MGTETDGETGTETDGETGQAQAVGRLQALLEDAALQHDRVTLFTLGGHELSGQVVEVLQDCVLLYGPSVDLEVALRHVVAVQVHTGPA